jgi:hypothetical protein
LRFAFLAISNALTAAQRIALSFEFVTRSGEFEIERGDKTH